jgi:hypothetical protein
MKSSLFQCSFPPSLLASPVVAALFGINPFEVEVLARKGLLQGFGGSEWKVPRLFERQDALRICSHPHSLQRMREEANSMRRVGLVAPRLPVLANPSQAAWILDVPVRLIRGLIKANFIQVDHSAPPGDWFFTDYLFSLREDSERMSRIAEWVRKHIDDAE